MDSPGRGLSGGLIVVHLRRVRAPGAGLQVRSLTSTNESPHPELGSLQNFWRSAENFHTGADYIGWRRQVQVKISFDDIKM